MEESKQNTFLDHLPSHIHYLLHWEQQTPDRTYLIQPLPTGEVKSYTWKQVADQVRRMAAYIQSLDLAVPSQIAIYGKNSAHWIMADLAIWMAGHISVPLYTTLNAEGTQYVIENS